MLENCVKQQLDQMGLGAATVTVSGSSVTVVFKTNPQSASSTGDEIISRICGCGAGSYSVTGEDELMPGGGSQPPLYSSQGNCP